MAEALGVSEEQVWVDYATQRVYVDMEGEPDLDALAAALGGSRYSLAR